MAIQSEEEKILNIKVKYEDAIYGIMRYQDKIKALKADIKTLQEQEKKGTITRDEQRIKTEAINATIKEYQYNVRTLQKEIQNNIRQEEQQTGSLKSMRAELSNLTKAYSEMSKAERDGARGKELQAHINALTDDIKEVEEGIQLYQRSVGNYKNAITEAIFGNSRFGASLQAIVDMAGKSDGLIGQLSTRLGAFKTTVLSLVTNPYFLAMAGVAGAGMAFKWFYDYNKGLLEATRLTREFTGYTDEALETMRNSIQATADVMGKDFKEVLSTADALMAQYHLSGEQAMKVINDGFASGADLSGDMLQKIQQYAPTFHDAGISADELVAILQQTRSGIFSDKGMDLITMASKRIREMGTSTASALDDIGISSKKVEKELKDGTKNTFDIIQQIATKLKEFPADSQQVGNVLKDVFGKQGASAGLQLIEQLDTMTTKLDDVKKQTGAWGKVQEENIRLQRELNTYMSSMFDFSQKGFASIITAGKQFGTKVLIQILKGLFNCINYFIDWYNKSLLLRYAVQSIGIQFKVLWQAVKLVCNLVIDAFKRMGTAARGMLDVLEGIATFDLSKARQGFKEMFDISGTIKEAWGDIKEAGVAIGNAYMDGLENTIHGRLDKLKLANLDGGATSEEVKNGTKNSKTSAELAAEAKAAAAAKKKADAEAKAVAEAKKKENEEIKKAEDLLTKLIEDNAKRQRQIIVNSYDQRIQDIKVKLETEKNLTISARKAMNIQIEALEKLKNRDLEKFDAEQIQKQVEFENKRITLILQSVKKGSDQERDLKIKELDNREQLDIAQATKDYTNEEQRQQMILAIQKSYNAQREKLEAEYYNNMLDKQQEAIRRKYEKTLVGNNNELEQERTKLKMLKEMRANLRQKDQESDEDYAKRKEDLDKQITDSTKQYSQKRVEVETAAASAIGDAFGSLSEVVSAAGENDKELTKLAKALALAQVAINIGVAISKMVTAESGKGIAGIATAASGVASILAQMASAISIIKSAKFAKGGYVSGSGTGTSDSIPARLSNGESVMTAKATTMFSPILSAFNQLGGGVPIVVNNGGSNVGMDMLAAAVAKGYMMAPRPVVSVEEINNTQNRVRTIESLAMLG